MEQTIGLSGTLPVCDAANICWDALIIGAGLSGSVAARQIARKGHRVLVVDRRHFPRKKVCGACLNRAAIDLLQELGLADCVRKLGGQSLNRFVLGCGSRSLQLPLPGGMSISRELLDAELLTQSIVTGCDFIPNSTAKVGANYGEYRSAILVHANHETVVNARTIVVAAGLEGLGHLESNEWTTTIHPSGRLGIGCTIADASTDFAPGTIWMATGAHGYVGLVRVEDGRLNIAAAVDRQFLRERESPTAAVSEILKSANFPIPLGLSAADWLGTVPLTRQTRPVASHRVFLVGDAAGYVEPFTGEGMTWALLAGCHVARWVDRSLSQCDWSDDFAFEWNREYRSLIKNRQRLCRVSTQLLRSKILVQIGMSALMSWPWLARRLLAHINAPGTQGRLADECRS